MLKERYVTYINGVGDHHDFDDRSEALCDAEKRRCPCVDHYQFWEDGRTTITSLVRGKAPGQWVPESQPLLAMRPCNGAAASSTQKNVHCNRPY